jgi:hypothetical protein
MWGKLANSLSQVNIKGGFIIRLPPHKVASHEKILIPVGIAIVIVALEK